MSGMNPEKSSNDHDQDDSTLPPSGSLFINTTSASVPRPGPSTGSIPNVSSDDDGSLALDISSPQQTSSVKVRNVSRERPPLSAESHNSKRLRVSDEQEEDEDDGDGKERDDGIHMDTDTSSNEGASDREELMEIEEEKEDEEKNVEGLGAGKIRNRRGSTDDVSTTMQSSSLRHRPAMIIPSEDLNRDRPRPRPSRTARFVMDEAIASTSAAAMAPPLSRMMEESPILDRRMPIFEQGEADPIPSGSQRKTVHLGATGSSASSRFLENVDVNENKGSDEFVKENEGKNKMMWARKLFLVGTDLVFPGFSAAYSDCKNHGPAYNMGVRVRSSCMMQALLYADSLFFIMWVLSFLSTFDILTTVLKQLHGYLAICLTGLFILVNILRLHFGMRGNENDEVQYLALFWMTTVIVQIPLFTFIFLTDLFCPVLMAFTVTMDGIMILLILIESVIGFVHFRSVLRDELNVIRIARRRKEVSQSRSGNLDVNRSLHDDEVRDPELGSNVDTARKNISARLDNDIMGDGDSSSENDSENDLQRQQRSMDFRMRIQRLSETQQHQQQGEQLVGEEDDSDSNSSEQVTSTSDAIHQRPIRAH